MEVSAQIIGDLNFSEMVSILSNLFRDFSLPAMDVKDKTILVTGGTGTFGKAFVRLLLEKHSPRKVVVFSRDEQKQFDMAQEFPLERYPAIRYFIGDVRDADRLYLATRDVDIVVHAAAMKHVTIAEYNPFECVRTNVHGAENIVRAALQTGVKHVIALSTDKAANPINLYGATKLASDKIFVAANNLSGFGGPAFSVVRYGNVIGSRGSVLPYFRKLLAQGTDHLPITDPRMTRFWITIEQGTQFVLSSMSMMRGGEIFVPKIPSMNITDLASLLAPGLEQRVIGVRPGEKLHETMISDDEARNTIQLSDRYVIKPELPAWPTGDYDALGAKPVDSNFRYSSNTNTEWLDQDSMAQIIEKTNV